MQYILAIDQGTTSSRAILFDVHGRSIKSAQKEFRQIFPRPGWVEHDANEIWSTQREVIEQVLDLPQSHTLVDLVAGIAITNQRETTVLWDRYTGEPIANAIVWQDRRTVDVCNALRGKGHTQSLQDKTGLVLDAYFSATKLAWLLDNTPGARARAERGDLAFGTIDTWLLWKLTNGKVHATDPSNASRTLLFNLQTMRWDEELLKLFNIPRAVLPEIRASGGHFGESDPTLFSRALPIAAMIGDQQAATFGQACFSPGMAKNTYGTGCFMLLNTENTPVNSANKLLTTVGWQRKDVSTNKPVTTYCLEASVFMGGATIQWLRDGLNIIQSAADVESLAQSVSDVGDTYLVPAFTGLGAPHWDGHARGTLIGMTRGTTKAHIARAALEAIALQIADVFDAMQKDSGIALSELRVDGGASKNNLLMQIQADFLGIPVIRPSVTETTALGAAYMAGLTLGFWSDTAQISSQWLVDRRFEPRLSEAERLAKLARWHQAVERAKGWAQD